MEVNGWKNIARGRSQWSCDDVQMSDGSCRLADWRPYVTSVPVPLSFRKCHPFLDDKWWATVSERQAFPSRLLLFQKQTAVNPVEIWTGILKRKLWKKISASIKCKTAVSMQCACVEFPACRWVALSLSSVWEGGCMLVDLPIALYRETVLLPTRFSCGKSGHSNAVWLPSFWIVSVVQCFVRTHRFGNWSVSILGVKKGESAQQRPLERTDPNHCRSDVTVLLSRDVQMMAHAAAHWFSAAYKISLLSSVVCVNLFFLVKKVNLVRGELRENAY